MVVCVVRGDYLFIEIYSNVILDVYIRWVVKGEVVDFLLLVYDIVCFRYREMDLVGI